MTVPADGRGASISLFLKRAGVFSIVAPVVTSIVKAGSPALDLLATAGCAIGSHEAALLLRKCDVPISTTGAITGAVLVLRGRPVAALATAIGGGVMGGPHAAKRAAASAAVATALAGPLRLGLRVRAGDRGADWLAWGMMTSWLADAADYLAGPWMPGPRLPKWINRHKSLAGYGPGIAAGALSGVLAAPRLGLSHRSGVLAGTTIGASAAVGDMAESMLKRRAGVSDSGRAVPGFGGILDRLDSLCASTVALYLIASTANRRRLAGDQRRAQPRVRRRAARPPSA